MTTRPRSRRDLFTPLLGGGRGLDAEASYKRDIAATSLEQFLHGQDKEVFAALSRFSTHPQAARLREEAAQRLVEQIWRGWWIRGINLTANMLGMSGRGRTSPWLLASGIHNPLSSIEHRFHISALGLDCAGLTSDDQNVRTLCGLGISSLFTSDSNHCLHMPRGAWKTPALYAAEHCQECAGLAKTLAVPALEEEPLFFSNENCYEQRLPEFIALTRSLLDNGSGLAQTRLVLNRRVRATIVNAFAETVAADPLPVFINTLSVGTRSVPTDITQPRLQAALADLPWAQLLARSMPRVLTDKCAPHLLQEALGEAVPIIIRSQVHCG